MINKIGDKLSQRQEPSAQIFTVFGDKKTLDTVSVAIRTIEGVSAVNGGKETFDASGRSTIEIFVFRDRGASWKTLFTDVMTKITETTQDNSVVSIKTTEG